MARRKIDPDKQWALWRLTDHGLAAFVLGKSYTEITRLRINGEKAGAAIDFYATQDKALLVRNALSLHEQGRTLVISTRLV